MAGYALPIGGSLTFTARQDRQARAALLQPGPSGLQVTPGVRPGPGLDVSVAGSTITVTPGASVVQSAASSTAGAYWAWIDAAWTATLTAADAANPRSDLVYLRVRDTDEDGSGARDCTPVYVPGTPAAAPSAPTIPIGTSGVILGVISVPKSGSGSPTVSTTTRQITVAAGGVQPVFDPAVLSTSGLYTGQVRYNGVRGLLEYWTGSAWTAQGDWSAYTPSWGSNGTAPVINNGSLTGRWTRIGRTIHVLISWLAGSTTTYGSGEWTFSLPTASAGIGSNAKFWTGTALGINPGAAYWPGISQIESGASVVRMLSPTSAAGTTSSRWTPTVPQTWATNHQINVSIAYEAAA